LSYGEHFGGAAKNFYRLIRDVDFSNFDYVSLADQDDIWLPNKLSHAVNIMQNNSVVAYSSDVLAFWANGREKLVKKSFPQKRLDYYFESSGPGCTYVLNCDSAMLLKVFINNNWEDVNYIGLHDWLMYAFCRSRDMPWYIDSKVLMLYRQHESNQLGLNFGFKAYLKRIKMIKSGWYRTEVRKISELTSNDDCNEFNLDTWFLVKNFYQLRRKNRDVFLLLLMILIGLF
jgi:rhamnosyltransferase